MKKQRCPEQVGGNLLGKQEGSDDQDRAFLLCSLLFPLVHQPIKVGTSEAWTWTFQSRPLFDGGQPSSLHEIVERGTTDLQYRDRLGKINGLFHSVAVLPRATQYTGNCSQVYPYYIQLRQNMQAPLVLGQSFLESLVLDFRLDVLYNMDIVCTVD